MKHTAGSPDRHGTQEHPEIGYEATDFKPRGVIYFAVILFISLIVVGFIIAGFMRIWSGLYPGTAPLQPVYEASQIPPAPRLEALEGGELRRVREHEDALLNGTGPGGRMPITQAMETLVRQGLPARAQAPAITPPPPVATPRPDRPTNYPLTEKPR